MFLKFVGSSTVQYILPDARQELAKGTFAGFHGHMSGFRLPASGFRLPASGFRKPKQSI